jgi:hypothetical protein
MPKGSKPFPAFFFLIVQFCTNVVENKMKRKNSVADFLFFEGKNGSKFEFKKLKISSYFH